MIQKKLKLERSLEIAIPLDIMDTHCFHCESEVEVDVRQFEWYYRPRRKYSGPPRYETPHYTILEVEMCQSCYHVVQHLSVVGWDWYSAYDDIMFHLQDHATEIIHPVANPP